jgi:hypothetical protein
MKLKASTLDFLPVKSVTAIPDQSIFRNQPADGTLADISRDFGTSVWQLSVKVICVTAPKHTILEEVAPT